MTQDPYRDVPPAPTTPATTAQPPPASYLDEPVIVVEETEPVFPAHELPTREPAPATGGAATEQAEQLGQGAADAGKHVAGVAKEQAGQVADEAKAQARDVLSQARTELQGQADTQKQRAAAGLHSISRELDSMADGSQDQGVAADLARQGSHLVREAATWLDDRDPGTLLEEVRTFARRRPGAFLGIALTAGVVAGRLTRGLKDSDDGPAPAAAPPPPEEKTYGGDLLDDPFPEARR